MPDENLRLFVFRWTNHPGGIDRTRVIVETSEAAARKLFEESEKRVKEVLEGEVKNKWDKELLESLLTKDDLEVREYPIQKGVMV